MKQAKNTLKKINKFAYEILIFYNFKALQRVDSIKKLFIKKNCKEIAINTFVQGVSVLLGYLVGVV